MSLPHQLDRCDICGRKTHKIDLVRTNVDFLAAAGSNYFDYSSYNSSFWTVSNGTDSGVVAVGPFADRARIRVSDDNTSTEILGSQTWTVGAGIGAYSGFFQMVSSAVDISSWTSFTVSFDFGYYQQDQTSQRVMVYAYIKDASENSSGVIKRFQGVYPSGRYWWYSKISDIDSDVDLSTAKFYLVFATYTGEEKIWVDRMQLEKNPDTSRMGAFVPTSGASVDRIDTRSMTVRKVCDDCFESPWKRSEQYNRQAEQRVEEPVAVQIQGV